jgi:hypothetical protein
MTITEARTNYFHIPSGTKDHKAPKLQLLADLTQKKAVFSHRAVRNKRQRRNL